MIGGSALSVRRVVSPNGSSIEGSVGRRAAAGSSLRCSPAYCPVTYPFRFPSSISHFCQISFIFPSIDDKSPSSKTYAL